MNVVGTGFISRTLVPFGGFGGFVVSFGLESGTGIELVIPPEDLFQSGRRDVRILAHVARGPLCTRLFVDGDKEEVGVGSSTVVVRRAPTIFSGRVKKP